MDTDLVIRAQRGDEQAFASLAVAVGNRLHALSHRILRDVDLAEDAVQQTLVAIWRDLPQLRDPEFDVPRSDGCCLAGASSGGSAAIRAPLLEMGAHLRP